MKIIEAQKINSCVECPHRDIGYCLHPDCNALNSVLSVIPSWCPLKDFTEPVQPCTDWGHDVDKYYKEPRVENPYPDIHKGDPTTDLLLSDYDLHRAWQEGYVAGKTQIAQEIKEGLEKKFNDHFGEWDESVLMREDWQEFWSK